MSRRSVSDEDSLQHPLLPTDDSTPLLRAGTLPHATTGGVSMVAMNHSAAIQLDLDSSCDEDASSQDSFGSSSRHRRNRGRATTTAAAQGTTTKQPSTFPRSTFAGGTRHSDPSSSTVSSSAPVPRPLSIDEDLSEAANNNGVNMIANSGRLIQLPMQLSAASTPGLPPTPLPALMSHGAKSSMRIKRIKRVSNYVLGPLMGEGTLGHVRDALDISKREVERVAIKTIRRKHRSEHELRRVAAILENEVEHLQRYHHVNIMRAVDIFHRDGKDYIALPIAVCSLEQLVQFRRKEIQRRRLTLFSDKASDISQVSLLGGGGGGASATNIASGRTLQPPNVNANSSGFNARSLFPMQLVKDVVFQILSGLAYLHKQDVSHNDLKPDNILLFNDGIVKVSDLGSCGCGYRGRGTPAFISPQVASGSGEPIDGKKNDVWAVGVMLYYLLTNLIPFHRENEYALYDAIAKAEVNYDLVPCDDYDPPSKQPSPVNNSSMRSQASNGSHHSSGGFSVGGANAKHLLRLLLEKNQDRRITASEALQHPWFSSCGVDGSVTEVAVTGSNPQLSPPGKRRSVDVSPEKVAGSLKRVVFNVRELATVMERDAMRHLQFVCEVAHTSGLAIPSMVFRDPDNADEDSDDIMPYGPGDALLTSGTRTEPTRVSVVSAGQLSGTGTDGRRDTMTAGAAGRGGVLQVHDGPPRGTVTKHRFMGVEELAHYGRKGRPECDVRSLRLDGLKRAMINDYMVHIVGLRGYLGRKRQLQALGLPDDDAKGESKKCCIIC